MSRLERLKEDRDRLLAAAKEAPLAKIYQDHKEHRFIGVHTDAWSRRSRELMAVNAEIARLSSALTTT